MFHVTNRGYSSSSDSTCGVELVFRPRVRRFGSEKIELRDDPELFELSDGVLDAADGLIDEDEDDEAGEGFSNLLIAAGLYGDALVCVGAAD